MVQSGLGVGEGLAQGRELMWVHLAIGMLACAKFNAGRSHTEKLCNLIQSMTLQDGEGNDNFFIQHQADFLFYVLTDM